MDSTNSSPEPSSSGQHRVSPATITVSPTPEGTGRQRRDAALASEVRSQMALESEIGIAPPLQFGVPRDSGRGRGRGVWGALTNARGRAAGPATAHDSTTGRSVAAQPLPAGDRSSPSPPAGGVGPLVFVRGTARGRGRGARARGGATARGRGRGRGSVAAPNNSENASDEPDGKEEKVEAKITAGRKSGAKTWSRAREIRMFFLLLSLAVTRLCLLICKNAV